MPDMILRCIDLETTGMEPPAYPIEVGLCDLIVKESGERLVVEAVQSWLMNPKPGEKIPSEAKAVHHITEAMIDLTAPDVLNREQAIEKLTYQLSGESGPTAIVAHQAKFERQWLDGLADKPWICTWKVACNKFPDLPAHSLQVLRYEFNLDAGAVSEWMTPAHRAGPDAYCCARLIEYFLAYGITVREMLEISKRPCLLPRVTFGKHIGQKWHEVPSSYLDWCLKNIKDDEDIQHTAGYWLRIKGKG